MGWRGNQNKLFVPDYFRAQASRLVIAEEAADVGNTFANILNDVLLLADTDNKLNLRMEKSKICNLPLQHKVGE